MESAMVQIVENHAEVRAEVLRAMPDPTRPGFFAVEVRILSSSAVGSSPDLFAGNIGQIIVLTACADGEIARKVGTTVELRVRKAGPGLSFVEP